MTFFEILLHINVFTHGFQKSSSKKKHKDATIVSVVL